MTERSKKLIPDSNIDTVICILDDPIIKLLDYHDTYKVKSLFNRLLKLNHSKNSLLKMIAEVIEKVYYNQSNITDSLLTQKIEMFIRESKSTDSNTTEPFAIEPFLLEGINCNLLQPDGNGWQKGKIKICFEFIPEEPNLTATQEHPTETNSSPLDEIRQLSNELTSMVSIEHHLD